MALKKKRSHVLSGAELNTDRWHKHFKTIMQIFPNLFPPKLKKKPRNSYFMKFKPPKLPKGLVLRHKFRPSAIKDPKDKKNHRVDLEFNGVLTEVLRREFDEKLETDMEIIELQVQKNRGKPATPAIRIVLENLDENKSYEDEEVKLTAGLRASSRLLAWSLKNEDHVQNLFSRQ